MLDQHRLRSLILIFLVVTVNLWIQHVDRRTVQTVSLGFAGTVWLSFLSFVQVLTLPVQALRSHTNVDRMCLY